MDSNTPQAAAAAKPKLTNTNVTNRAHTKAFALVCARKFRHHKFTRVSEGFLDAIEQQTRAFIAARVSNTGSNPSTGTTLY